MRKITEQEFGLIKKKLRWAAPFAVAPRVGRHIAIVTKIDSCKSYEQYKKIVRAEHPPIKNSLADRVSDLERRVASLEEARERTKTQLALELNEGAYERRSVPRN